MKRFRDVCLFIAITGLGGLAPVAKAQSRSNMASSNDIVSTSASTMQLQLDLIYKRPTERTKLKNYLFDSFGPYAIASAAILGGIDQVEKSPPEWRQGAGGFGERVGSEFGISFVTTTTRYALAEAFREDTLYYRCECRGIFPRLGHAVISTVTARHGGDGHRRFSFPALVAPYAGSMTAVYGWYPNRYGVKDGMRMGSYTLLESVGVNIAREFIYGGPHALFSRIDRSASPGTDATAESRP
jgi:hypothetical protein